MAARTAAGGVRLNHPLIDIGVNLTSPQFKADLPQVIERALEASVRYMIVTGLTAPLSEEALALARAHRAHLCSTAGVHPHNAKTFGHHTRAELRRLALAPEVVAVGECGLDFDRDFSPRPAQRAAFESQLELAAELGKPVFLHERSAHADFYAIMKNARSKLVGGVVHCFTGRADELEHFLELGLCLGITGFICDDRRGTHLRDLVGRIPANRLMIETDAPFLLPRDLPGPTSRRNEPAYLPHVARSVARYAGIEEAELRQRTLRTAFELFGLESRFGAARPALDEHGNPDYGSLRGLPGPRP